MFKRWRWAAVNDSFAASLLIVLTLAFKTVAVSAVTRNTWFDPNETVSTWALDGSAALANNFWLLLPLAAVAAELPGRRGIWWAFGVNVSVTCLLLADLSHVEFYGEYLTFSRLSELAFVPTILPSLDAALHWWMLVYVADWPVAVWMLLRTAPRSTSRPRAVAIAMVIASCAMLVSSAVRMHPSVRANLMQGSLLPRATVPLVGLLPFHAIDVWRGLAGAAPHQEEDLAWLDDYLQHRGEGRGHSALAGVAANANLILISAESLHTFVIDRTVGGKEIAPNLSALARQSLYFRHFQDQTNLGTTSDAEFLALQSLHPPTTGAASSVYLHNQFYGLPRILGEAGYATLSAVGSAPWFWNVGGMHPRLGFAQSRFGDSFGAAERVNGWVADAPFLAAMATQLASHRQPFFAFLMLSSNHHPFIRPPAGERLPLGDLEGTLLGRYLETVHYADAALGGLVRHLADAGLLDRTVLAVYGDHQAFLGDTPGLATLLGFTDGRNEHDFLRTRKAVPLLIRLPHGNAAHEYRANGGHLDIAPTLLSVLGLRDPTGIMLGRDLTSATRPFTVFRDGSAVADGVHYRIRFDGYHCFRIADGVSEPCVDVDVVTQTAADQLRASDLLMKYNRIPGAAPPDRER